MTRFNSSKDDEGIPFYWSPLLSDDHCLTPDAVVFPFRLKTESAQIDLFSSGASIRANLSDAARAYLAKLGVDNPDADDELEHGLKPYELIWYHALAIGYSPAYLSENADGIRNDWPRIPLPAGRAELIESARLGKQIAALLDPEGPLPEILKAPEFARIATLQRDDGQQINPQQCDLALTAGWGHAQGNIVMPGQGKIVGQEDGALNIYLNDHVCWQNVPQAVWEYVIGGYQVIKKWLSYRENKILGRDITVEEAREVTAKARRIAALIALEKMLDQNYERAKLRS